MKTKIKKILKTILTAFFLSYPFLIWWFYNLQTFDIVYFIFCILFFAFVFAYWNFF